MKIVILAHPHDDHAAPICWALQESGYEAVCWSELGWQTGQQVSLHFNSATNLMLGPHSVEPGDVIWIRRPNPPQPNPRVQEEDRKFAEGEHRLFNRSILYILDELPVRCVNRYAATVRTGCKSLQLHTARNCGMRVPETLMSNAPQAVKSFVNGDGPAKICKAFLPHIWQKEDAENVAITETFVVTSDLLQDEEVLTYAPAIYQQKISKILDVRTVVLGSSLYSYAIRSSRSALDWRQDAWQSKVEIDAIAMPPAVEESMMEFVGRMGINFGSADFAIDHEGNWWFLEINEQGQFLWLDALNPALNVQQKFLAFLTLPEGASRPEIEAAQNRFPSLQDFHASPAKLDKRYEERSKLLLSYEK